MHYMDNSIFTGLPAHMKGLGLGALGHANWHSNYMCFENAYWDQLALMQAVHALELLIKARLCEIDPMTIFSNAGHLASGRFGPLTPNVLIQSGRTYSISSLPDILSKVANMQLRELQQVHRAAHIRNTIQHFATPKGVNFSLETQRLVFGTIEPLIHECWGLYAIDFIEDGEPHEIFRNLKDAGISYLLPPGCEEYSNATGRA